MKLKSLIFIYHTKRQRGVPENDFLQLNSVAVVSVFVLCKYNENSTSLFLLSDRRSDIPNYMVETVT